MKKSFRLLAVFALCASLFLDAAAGSFPYSGGRALNGCAASCLAPVLSAGKTVYVDGVGDVMACFDLSDISSDERKAGLVRLMLRFKFGDEAAVDELAAGICRLISPRLVHGRRYAFMFRFGALPHATYLMSEKVVRMLAGQGYDCFIAPIRQKSWPPSYTSVLSVEKRFGIIDNTMEVTQDLSGVSAVIMDDVIASGGYMREMIRSVGRAGAEEIIPAVYVKADSGANINFELLAFEDGAKNLESVVKPLVSRMRGRISQSGLKYLMRMASKDEQRVANMLSSFPHAVNMELFVRAVSYFADVPKGQSGELVPFFRVLSRAISEKSVRGCFIPLLGAELDFPFYVGHLADDAEIDSVLASAPFSAMPDYNRTLWTHSQSWPNLNTLFVFALAAGYSYVVLTDRRTMSDEDTDKAVKIAYRVGVSLCSPYFTTLRRFEYAPLDALDHEIQAISSRDENLAVFRSGLRSQRAIARELILESGHDLTGITGASMAYNAFVRKLVSDVGHYCLSKVDPEGRRAADIAVFLTGSTASGSATLNSDIEFDIICRDDAAAQWATENFAPVFTRMLRTVGFDLGPDDKLQREHWENRYELKSMQGSDNRLFHPKMQPSTYLIACTKAFSGEFIFGDIGLARGWSDVVFDESRSALLQTDILPSLSRTVDTFLSISRDGQGVFSGRNMIVAYNRSTGYVFSIQMLILRAFTLAMHEVVLGRVMNSDSRARPWLLARHPLEMLREFWQMGWFAGLEADEYSLVYESLSRLLAARQKKAVLKEESIYAGVHVSDLYVDFFADVAFLLRFLDRYVVAARPTVFSCEDALARAA